MMFLSVQSISMLAEHPLACSLNAAWSTRMNSGVMSFLGDSEP